jgi:hypothetical protein
VQVVIARAIYLAHPSGAKQFEDLVPADSGANERRHTSLWPSPRRNVLPAQCTGAVNPLRRWAGLQGSARSRLYLDGIHPETHAIQAVAHVDGILVTIALARARTRWAVQPGTPTHQAPSLGEGDVPVARRSCGSRDSAARTFYVGIDGSDALCGF